MTQVGVIDYGMGNLKSISNAFLYLGINPKVCSEPDQIFACERLVIPGVGAYFSAMRNLDSKKFVKAIQSFAGSGGPLLGICLGMQLFSSLGTEPRETAGLNLIPGNVIPLPKDKSCRVPHVGWNNVKVERGHPLFEGIKDNLDWYFVHSYQFVPSILTDSLAVTDYGVTFHSAISRRNIVGVQFHPEKSQDHGLCLLNNFVSWNGRC